MNEEEKTVFSKAMHNVRRLKPVNFHFIKTTAPLSIQSRPRFSEKSIEDSKLFSGLDIQSTAQACDILYYYQQGVSDKCLKRLRQGKIRPQARVDLHHLSAAKAQAFMNEVIARAISCDQRCLLVIHGKGHYSLGPPVIKNLLNQWLPTSPEVMAFHSALPKDGGTGAIYLLLKKHSRF